MSYAKGKYALGICDYCGQQFKLNELRKNWRGFKVCEDDYEPKEPQLEPLRYRGDAIALFEPRPDRVQLLYIYLGAPGNSAFQSIGSAYQTNDMRPFPVSQPLVASTSVGKMTVVAT